MNWDPYKIMGVGKGFTKFEITKRMRELAKELHPDHEGGDEEKFKEMMEAYALLTTPERRERFDTTDERGRETPFLTKFREMVGAIFLQIVSSTPNPTKKDLVQIFKDAMRQNISAVDKGIREANQKIGKLEGIKKRITKKGKGDNILAQAVQAQADVLERQVVSSKEDLDFLCKSKDILDEYNYDWDKMEQIQMGVGEVTFDTTRRVFTFRDEK